MELQQRAFEYSQRDGRIAEDEYFFAEQNARLAEQFDAVLHFDHTRAVEPLERTAEWQRGEVPETFPSGVQAKKRLKAQG